METWDAITSRRNVRQFSPRSISPSDLDRILEAGRRTPSASNVQPWDFIVVTDPQVLAELPQVWRGAAHLARGRAAIVLVAPDAADPRTRELTQYDLGQATMSIMLAAADLGIGTGHSSVDDQDLARRLLGVPDDRVVAWMMALGYPEDRPLAPISKPMRRPFDEVVHRERW
jgi:nitroreductase